MHAGSSFYPKTQKYPLFHSVRPRGSRRRPPPPFHTFPFPMKPTRFPHWPNLKEGLRKGSRVKARILIEIWAKNARNRWTTRPSHRKHLIPLCSVIFTPNHHDFTPVCIQSIPFAVRHVHWALGIPTPTLLVPISPHLITPLLLRIRLCLLATFALLQLLLVRINARRICDDAVKPYMVDTSRPVSRPDPVVGPPPSASYSWRAA